MASRSSSAVGTDADTGTGGVEAAFRDTGGMPLDDPANGPCPGPDPVVGGIPLDVGLYG